MIDLSARIEQLARLRCKAMGWDPDKLVPHGPVQHFSGMSDFVPERPLWENLKEWAERFAVYEAALEVEQSEGETK